MPDILEYTLAQVRAFVAAVGRSDASRDARLLSLFAVGGRGESRQIDRMLDSLTERAQTP